MIPITAVKIGRAEEKSVLTVLRSGAIAQGSVVSNFEHRFAELAGTKHAVAVNNGTTSLIAALQVLDLKTGDEVITSPFTFVATLNAIIEAGATAVFADINEDDFNVNPARVQELVNERTKVLMPVHLYGQMADMSPLQDLAQRKSLFIVEDAAQAHGAQYNGIPAGSFGMGSFSFYATKNLTTGEGGIVTTDSDDLADKIRVLRNQGMRARYQYEMAGNNYRLTDLQAALVLPQLDRYRDVVKNRQRNAAMLSKGLRGVPGLHVPQQLPGRSHVWHQYTVRIDDSARVSRDEFVSQLADRGVGAGVYYPKTVFDYEPYREHPQVKVSSVPIAERVVKQVVSLPVHQHLKNRDIRTIVTIVREILGG